MKRVRKDDKREMGKDFPCNDTVFCPAAAMDHDDMLAQAPDRFYAK
jgi:hypothetical protein